MDEKQWMFIAFGEGKHQCIGRDFAFLQVKAIWSYLFRHFDFEVTNPVPTNQMEQDFSTLVAGPNPAYVNARFKRVNLLKEKF